MPTNPTSGQLFGNSNTYNRPGQSYAALRAIFGNDQWVKVNKEIQTDYKYGSISPEQEIAVYHKYLPNQSKGCHNKLDAFFKQWWYTSYSGTPGGRQQPSITGPGLAGGGFYDANGGCSDYGIDVPRTPGATVPATLGLSLGAPAALRRVHAGRGEGLHRDDDRQRDLDRRRRDAVGRSTRARPLRAVWSTARSACRRAEGRRHQPGEHGAGAGSVSGTPLTLTSWSSPVSNDPVQVCSRRRSVPTTRCAPARTARR